VYIEKTVLNITFRYTDYTHAAWRQAFRESADLLSFAKLSDTPTHVVHLDQRADSCLLRFSLFL